MAKTDEKNKKTLFDKSSVNTIMKSIQTNISNIYKNTHMTNQTNHNDLNNLKSSIDKSIDNIIDNVQSTTGLMSMSKVFSRLQSEEEKKSNNSVNKMEEMFTEKAISDEFLLDLDSYKCIEEYDEDIDIICKYMPLLEDTLEAKKDNVLSADHFSKDFLNVINESNIDEEVSFNDRIELLKKKYNLIDLVEEIYYNTDKYGEVFLYNDSYKNAISNLLNKKSKCNMSGLYETFDFDPSSVLNESSLNDDTFECDGKFKLTLNMSGKLDSVTETYSNAQTVLEKTELMKNKVISSTAKFKGINNKFNDGLIDTNSIKSDDIQVQSTILKILPRKRIKPIYIEDMCIGYYYLECEDIRFDEMNIVNRQNTMLGLKSNGSSVVNKDAQKNLFLKKLSMEMSKKVDAAFINNNQDISEEIYTLLKYNDLNSNNTTEIKVTFIPPENMLHIYFKRNPVTKRGISGLDKAILPAKLYTGIYITDTLGILTRSQDKRVYYVKQAVDTNISKVLMNTINQIKKSNMGARDIISAKNLLNVVGRYNDHVIPVGASGSPVEFEVMPGQNIEIKTELLDMFEQAAINSTGVPYEYVQSRKSVDYAVRLTMSSGKFLRTTFKDQAKLEVYLSKLITTLYNNEYNENDELKVTLPPPTFLNLLNTNQIMDSTKQQVASIIESEFAGEDDAELIAYVTKKLNRHYLGTYIDSKAYDIIAKSRIEYKAEKKSNIDQ